MREIADLVGAYLMVDMAHFSGLVAAKEHPSPFPYAHVATSTTHKTLRGPRGGIILSNDETLAKKFNSAIFPGLQGGPLMHVIAAKAIAFGEALTPEFKEYTKNVIVNAKTLSDELINGGLAVITGGTDTHVLLVDLRPKGVKSKLPLGSIPAPVLQLGVGIPFDTEIILRYSPEYHRNGVDMSLKGLGVKHNLLQYFGPIDKFPLNVSQVVYMT